MMENRLHWWQRPQLRTEGEEERERKVTWLELFFDLVRRQSLRRLADEDWPHHFSRASADPGAETEQPSESRDA